MTGLVSSRTGLRSTGGPFPAPVRKPRVDPRSALIDEGVAQSRHSGPGDRARVRCRTARLDHWPVARPAPGQESRPVVGAGPLHWEDDPRQRRAVPAVWRSPKTSASEVPIRLLARRRPVGSEIRRSLRGSLKGPFRPQRAPLTPGLTHRSRWTTPRESRSSCPHPGFVIPMVH
jgi:hypothetical protein